MKRPEQQDDYAETLVMEDTPEAPEVDPEATAVLDEEHRRELNRVPKPSK
jgi:hypothetical protein